MFASQRSASLPNRITYRFDLEFISKLQQKAWLQSQTRPVMLCHYDQITVVPLRNSYKAHLHPFASICSFNLLIEPVLKLDTGIY